MDTSQNDCIVITTATGQELHFPHIQDFKGRPFLTPTQIQKLLNIPNQKCGINPVDAYVRNHIYLSGEKNMWKTQPDRCYAKFSARKPITDGVYDSKELDTEMISWVRKELPNKTTWFIVFGDGFMDYMKNNTQMTSEQRKELQPVVDAMRKDFFRIPDVSAVKPLKSHCAVMDIDGKTICVYDWNNEKTISALAISAMHGIKPEVVNRAITRNKDRFNQDGEEDYFEFRSYQGIEKLKHAGYEDLVEDCLGKNRAQFLCRLLTYKGYVKLCLSALSDDKAWTIKESIVTGVFNQEMPKIASKAVIAPVTDEVAMQAETHDVSIAQILYEAASRISKFEKEKHSASDARDELIEQLRAELKSSQENSLYLTKQIGSLKRDKESLFLELQGAKKIERDHKQASEESMNRMSGEIAGLKHVFNDALTKINQFENIFAAYGMNKKSASKKMEEKTVNIDIVDVNVEESVIPMLPIVNNIDPQEPIDFNPVEPAPQPRKDKALHPATIAEDLGWARAASGMPATELVNRFAEAAGIDMSTDTMHEDEYSATRGREVSRNGAYIKTVSFVGIKRAGVERILNYVKEHGREHLSHKLQNFDTYKTSGNGHKVGEYSQIAFRFDGHPNDIKVRAMGFDLEALGLTDAPSRRPLKEYAELEEEARIG